MTNAIRPDGVASLQGRGEVQPPDLGRSGKHQPLRGSVRKRVGDAIGWLATERNQKAVHVKQGDLPRAAVSAFMLEGAEEPRPGAGVRAAIVVRKRRNGRGAKGCRKVKT
jgi:hypothetical protein